MGVQGKLRINKALAAVMAVAVLVFATAAPAAEGPTLPPAEYKPLPVGTVIKYNDRKYEVKRTEGHLTVFRGFKGGNLLWVTTYSLFGETGADVFVFETTGDPIEYTLSDENKKKLETFWPLKVNKEIRYQLHESANVWSQTPEQIWTIRLKVPKTEVINIGGYEYGTFVIDEQAESDQGMSFVSRKWYHPESGLILRSSKTWTGITTIGMLNYFKNSSWKKAKKNITSSPASTTPRAPLPTR